MSEIRAFELEAFEAEHPRTLDAAREEARRLLRAVLDERDRIRASAREEGRAAGHREGLRLGREEASAELARLTAMVEAATEALRAHRARLAAASENDLVRLAVSIAERILKVEVRERAWEIAAANLRRAMELAVRRQGVVVRVHPEDLEGVRERLPGVIAAFPDAEGLTLQADEAVARGGCAIATEEGGVDADLRIQLDEIERGLVG